MDNTILQTTTRVPWWAYRFHAPKSKRSSPVSHVLFLTTDGPCNAGSWRHRFVHSIWREKIAAFHTLLMTSLSVLRYISYNYGHPAMYFQVWFRDSSAQASFNGGGENFLLQKSNWRYVATTYPYLHEIRTVCINMGGKVLHGILWRNNIRDCYRWTVQYILPPQRPCWGLTIPIEEHTSDPFRPEEQERQQK